jgi:DNA helicase-2/ATP-dependent DNA helicase PcrA
VSLPVDVAIIDEAQDLTTLQWKMCEVAFRDCKQVFIAGDDDQAIYEWSGADVDHFLSLEGEREVLMHSWRLQKKTLNVARRVSAMIEHRVAKNYEPVGDEGEVFVYNTIDEIVVDPKQSWYFLSRNNYFLTYYRESLKKRALVYIDKGKMSFDPTHIEAINVFERARRTGRLTDIDQIKLKLYMKTVPDLTKPWYDNVNFANDEVAYYRDLIQHKTDLKNQNLTVSTIHGVKGGEADNVVLLLDFTRSVKTNMEQNPDSELRCLYVALTRAKRHLHIVYSTSRNGYDNYMKVTGGQDANSSDDTAGAQRLVSRT